MYFELERCNAVALPAALNLNGVHCRVFSGGVLADSVDVPTLPGLVADGYVVIMLTGTRANEEAVEVIYSLSGFYRTLPDGSIEILGSNWSEPPVAIGEVNDGALRMMVVASATKPVTSIHMSFRANVHREISSIWHAMVASQWPEVDSRDLTFDGTNRLSTIERAWHSPIVR